MPGIVLDGVTKRFGDVTAVDDVSLRAAEGELLVVVGPSGCGKTTLLRLIAGLEGPDAGEVIVDGRRVTDLPARKRDVSLVFQDFALFPHLSARENLAFDLRMQGYDDVDDRVEEAAELLDVADLLDRSIDALSGGQKQRVALGRAIVTDPTGFLLDEPLANLDANLRARMQTEIVRLQERLGVTTVHVTHDQSEALRMGDRVAVVADGAVQQVGPPEAVYRSPATLFVARFVGNPTMNLLRGRVDEAGGGVVLEDGTSVPLGDGDGPPWSPGDMVEAGGSGDGDASDTADGSPDGDAPDGADDSLDGRAVLLGVRPEHLGLADGPQSDDDGLPATVRFDAFEGADRFVHLSAPDETELVARVPAERTVEDGASVSISLATGRVHLFDAASGARLLTRPAPEPTEAGARTPGQASRGDHDEPAGGARSDLDDGDRATGGEDP